MTSFQAETVVMDSALQWYQYIYGTAVDVRIYSDAPSVLLAIKKESPTQLITMLSINVPRRSYSFVYQDIK